MKALTLHQPWASLVACGVKTIETRSWSTSYRGPLAIHAAVKVPRLPRFPTRKSQRTEPTAADVAVHELDDPTSAVPGSKICWCGHDALMCLRHGLCTLPLGEVLATCTLVDVVPCVDFMTERTDERTRVEHIADSLFLRVPRVVPALNVTDQLPYGDFTPGRFAWLLTDVTAIVPVSVRGRQGLWEWVA